MLAVPVCSVFIQAAASPQPHMYAWRSAHWGESNGLCDCSSPGPGLSPSTLAHVPFSLYFGGSIYTFPGRGREL